jgi:hypothetical protein
MAGMSTWKSACLPRNESRISENDHIQNVAREIFAQFAIRRLSATICTNLRSGAGSVACDENREILRGTVDMALGMYFTPSSFTPARYDDTIKRLEEAGAGSPPGRLYHVAMEADGLIQVFDVWESEASFQAFGKTLLPIMADLGADPGQPQASPIHNLIKG